MITTESGCWLTMTAGLGMAACGGSDEGSPQAAVRRLVGRPEETPRRRAGEECRHDDILRRRRTDLSAVKAYLLEHAGLLTGFTADLAADA